MAAIAFVGDIGTVIQVNTQNDLSAATNLEILILRPDGTILTKTAVIPVGLTAEDGIISYTTVDGDLNQAGTYKVQAHVEGPGTDHKGITAQFEVRGAFG